MQNNKIKARTNIWHTIVLLVKINPRSFFCLPKFFFSSFLFFNVLYKLGILPFKFAFRVLNVTIFRFSMLLFIVLYFLLFYPFLGFTVVLFSLNYFYLFPPFPTQTFSRLKFSLFFKQLYVHSVLNWMFSLNVIFRFFFSILMFSF